MANEGPSCAKGKDRNSASGLRSARVVVSYCALLVVCILAESEVVQRVSRAFFSVIIEAGKVILAAEDSAHHRSVIVPISEHDGSGLVAQWPLRFEVYARFLGNAWCLGAASVFVDISFGDHPRDPNASEDLDRLVQVVERISRAADDDSQAIEALNQSCVTPRHGPVKAMRVFFAPPTGLQAREKLADFLVGTRIEGSGTNHSYRRSDDAKNLPTAAFALARDACERGVAKGAPCRRLEKNKKKKYEIDIEDSILTPPEQASFTQPAYSEDSCVYANRWSLSNFGAMLDEADALLGRLYQGFTAESTSSWWSCPPILTVPFYRFTPPLDSETGVAIAGKIVILGSNIPANSDLVSTHYFREIPGAYLHALAVNALLSEQAPTVTSPIRLRIAALFVGSLIVVFLHRTVNAIGPGLDQNTGRKAALRAVSAAATGGGLVVLYICALSWNMTLAVSDGLCFLFCNNVDWRKFDPDPVRFLSETLHGLRRIVLNEL